MKKVIDSRNYVWIVTANTGYSKYKFTENYFGPADKDFFGKSHYFLFMNPDIMKKIYTQAKKDFSSDSSDSKLGNITDFGWDAIHTKGLKPYAMYAGSLLTRDEYNKKFTPKIGDFKIYLFDDTNTDRHLETNSKKLGITFTLVTDFATSPVPNLLTEFKKVLDDGTSKIGSAKAPFIPDEYIKEDVIDLLMADNTELPKCSADAYTAKPDFDKISNTPPTNNMIGNMKDDSSKISNNLEVCQYGDSKCGLSQSYSYSTDTDIKDTKIWNTSSDDFYSDHEPIKYAYEVKDDGSNQLKCSSSNTNTDDKTSFITWNIAYQMTYVSENKRYRTPEHLKSKFYCSEKDIKECVEEDKIYEKRMKNILTAIDTIMKNDYNKLTNYVFLQECTQTLLNVVSYVAGFDSNYQILYKGKNKGISEFCLVVRKSALVKADDIVFFDFDENMGDTPMSKYISDLFYSYDIEVNTYDLKKVMCYIVKSQNTIFFNVHFSFGNSFIFKRQTELYNFMNAIVYTIRSIPKENADLREYQNYDIVFTGDFNVNMLQRFPQDIKRFGYPDGNMIPIFFTCNYIPGQKTIISTTHNNLPTARATNGDKNNYNLTNIDFSILYPRIGDKGTGPIEVTILNGGIPKKQTLPVAPVGSGAPVSPGKSIPASTSTSTSANTLRVMSFNTWYKPFNAEKNNEDGTPQEPDMQYCNVTKDGKITNVCQENIMKEIMTQIKEGFEVIFLQEFTSRIQEVFKNYGVTFSDTKVPTTQIPFTMTYTPPVVGGSSLEYYVYSVTAQGETIVTLCSKNFFPKPATNYYMGNLTGYPNNPSYASDGDTIQGLWEISGGGRPYIVLVFDDIKMILVNIHGPHGGTFNPYLQKVSKNPSGQEDFTTIGERDENGPYKYEEIKYKYNSVFSTPINPSVLKAIEDKIKKASELNKEYPDPTLQDYSFRQLGDMLRSRIPEKLEKYNIIFAGDFNMRPRDAKTHLVKLSLSERQSNGKYSEGPFSDSSGNFDKQDQNSVTLTIGDTGKPSTGTCCVEHKGGSYRSIYDQIYSNKLKITKYWTYNGEIKYDKEGKKGEKSGILFSDHLPIYAEIAIPASGTPESSSGGSKRFTLRNNSNNNNKPTSRKIKKHASMPTTKFSKKKRHSMHKHKTRRHKH